MRESREYMNRGSQNFHKISVAVIGSGYWGKNLVRNYNDLGALRAICDKNIRILNEFKQKYPDVDTYMALSQVLKRDDIKAIVIATPAETHFALARESLLSGKHVYVEKPLVLDEKDAGELITLANEKKKILMVGHLLQYHPVFVKLKSLAAKGELGRINYIYSHRLNLGKIRREENILWSFAPHDISMILSLAKEEPESVFATGGNYLHKKIADVTTTHMEFPSGLKAHIFVSWLHPFKEQKLVVVGDKKMAVFDDTKPWNEKLLLYPHDITWEDNVPVPEKAEPETFDMEKAEPLKMECMHFLNCVATNKKPHTDGEEGLKVLKILNAGQKSLDRDGKKIIINYRIPEKTSKHDFFIHPTAITDENVSIGRETKIWHFSHILANTNIGKKCNIGQNVVIGPNVTVGNNCKIQNNVSVYKGVTLEDGVFCGPSMVFTNVYNPRSHIKKMDQIRPTLVKKGATIGANATIVCGITIGEYAFIGAGAVVVKNVPDYGLIVGNPGKLTGWVCKCGERLTDDLLCIHCDLKYIVKDHGGLSPA